jgi:RND family efflux transporter MFP subunit
MKYSRVLRRYCRVLVWGLLGTSASTVIAADDVNIIVALVQAGGSGQQDTLHCKVHSALPQLISSQAQAQLIWVLPQGSWVKKGQVVAKQHDYYLKQKVKVLQLAHEKAGVEVDYAGKEYQRLVLLPKKLRAVSLLDNSKKQHRLAQLNLQTLEQQLKEARYRLKQLVHLAPVSGEVDTLHATLGEGLAIGQSIVRIMPTENREFKCSVPLFLYQKSDGLNNSHFMLQNQQALRMKRRSAQVNEKSQTLSIYLTAGQGVGEQFLIGQRLKVVMDIPTQGLTEIPFDALNIANDAHYVWQFASNNTVAKVEVDVLSTKGNVALVKSSLVAFDEVVIKGKNNLSAGQKVSATKSGARL